MNDDDALPFEMRQLLGPRGSPPTLDDETADRLVAGRLDPADAPPGYAAVTKIVTVATAPATTEELAGEPAAVARFAAMARSGFPTRASTTRRAGVPRRALTVKAAVAVLAAVLCIGGVAAAAGVFPAPAQPAADHGPGSGTATPGSSDAATTAAARNRQRGSDTATGPDASGPAKHGLCRAWKAGRGKDKQADEEKDKQNGKQKDEQNGKREDSTAFRALAAAAGGADKIAAYCQATPAESAGQGQEHPHGEPPGKKR